MGFWSSFNFHLVKSLSRHRRGGESERVLYLTFDDGPESGITEFVVDTLECYGVKATFFCCGRNVEKHPHLTEQLRAAGHTLANHTYSHINGLNECCDVYLRDVDRADRLIASPLFRPPWGALTLRAYRKLRSKYDIVLWNIVSGDTKPEEVDVDKEVERMRKELRSGDIVLFHFCSKHAANTKAILPKFIEMALGEGYIFKMIER